MTDVMIGDTVLLRGGRRTTIARFSEDLGTCLSDGQWVCASELLPLPFDAGWAHTSAVDEVGGPADDWPPDPIMDAAAKFATSLGHSGGALTWEQCDVLSALLSVHAHELADQIRANTEQHKDRVASTYAPNYFRGWLFGRQRTADLIDPEVRQ